MEGYFLLPTLLIRHLFNSTSAAAVLHWAVETGVGVGIGVIPKLTYGLRFDSTSTLALLSAGLRPSNSSTSCCTLA